MFDWNRPGLDGKPREVHVEQSLKCIDFEDFEPALAQGELRTDAGQAFQSTVLVDDPDRDSDRRAGLLCGADENDGRHDVYG